MSGPLKFMAFILMAFHAGAIATDICMWVDEDGVTHFAETCPEGVAGKRIQAGATPSEKAAEAARLRSEAQKARREARKEREALEAGRAAEVQRAREEEAQSANQKCAEARFRLEILRKPLPVYLDQDHQLHYNRSLHHQWYQGPRTYLDDEERRAEILKYEREEAGNCTESETEISERVRMYKETRDREVCRFLQARLKAMREAHTGIPTDEMRALQEQVESVCY